MPYFEVCFDLTTLKTYLGSFVSFSVSGASKCPFPFSSSWIGIFLKACSHTQISIMTLNYPHYHDDRDSGPRVCQQRIKSNTREIDSYRDLQVGSCQMLVAGGGCKRWCFRPWWSSINSAKIHQWIPEIVTLSASIYLNVQA